MLTLRRYLQGQGLIETLITLLLISGSVIALIRFQSGISYTNALNQQQNTAFALALNQLETMRNYSSLAAYNALASGSSSSTVGNATYSLAWTVTTTAAPAYKTVNIVVTWTDQRNTSQSINLTSRIASIDPQYSAVVMKWGY